VEFVYLAVILDAYSRRVIGWELDDTMEDSLTLAALRMALSRRPVTPELVHHLSAAMVGSSSRLRRTALMA
jgi:transposase InsO family protein